jgi:hypothetical protein
MQAAVKDEVDSVRARVAKVMLGRMVEMKSTW